MATAREYDHLFKLLIIGDSGEYYLLYLFFNSSKELGESNSLFQVISVILLII